MLDFEQEIIEMNEEGIDEEFKSLDNVNIPIQFCYYLTNFLF
jgi:hypothetical protein